MSNMLGAHSALSIIKALDGNPTSGMCRCPAHDDNTASLHVTEKNGRVLVKCHADCSQQAVIGALRERGLWRSRSSSAAPPSERQPDDDASKEDEDERFRKAFAIMRAAALYEIEKPKQRDLLLGRYLRGRGIDDIPEAASLLSATDSARLTKRRYPAMVVPIIGDGKLKAAHVTFLSKDGSRKLDTDTPRLMYGPMKGGYVLLGTRRRDKPLILAEGIETALSASQITGLPAIAALSAANMRSVSLPDCSEVIIAGDNDDAGRKAANAAAQILASGGHRVRIALPDKPEGAAKFDWNDALNASTSIAKLRRSILRAKEFDGTVSEGARELTTRSVDQFEARDIEWLWHPFIPLGMITTIYGDGEVGKSTIAVDVAARITTGAAWPRFGDDKESRAPDGSVLILCKEDDVSRVIRPRLEAAKADISRVHIVGYANSESADDFDPLDRLDGMSRHLEQAVAKIGDVKLVIIDPITDYVGKLDMYRDDQVRALLNPLGRIAANNDLAVLNILHLNKKTDQAARYRTMGSVAFRNVSRSAIVVANSSDVSGTRLMMLEKANLTPEKRAVAFNMRTVRAQPRIQWDSDWQEHNVEDALSGKTATKQSQAADLLREWLEDGPRTATEIEKLAKENNISVGTLRLAKKAVGVKSEKDGKSNWTWRLA